MVNCETKAISQKSMRLILLLDVYPYFIRETKHPIGSKKVDEYTSSVGRRMFIGKFSKIISLMKIQGINISFRDAFHKTKKEPFSN